MWITLLVMAGAVSLEPFRIGMTAMMLNRPRPGLQLAAFLCGGYLMGLSVGTTVLFAVESWLPDSAQFTLPRVQVAVGALALVAAAVVVATSARARTAPAWLTRLLRGPSLRVAGLAGLGTALPSLDYLAALAVIAAATADAGTRLTGLLVFTAVAFATVEIPLLAYLVAPRRTRSAVTALHRRIRARGRRGVALVLAVVGIVLITAGAVSAAGS